jgi:hypothetical protein
MVIDIEDYWVSTSSRIKDTMLMDLSTIVELTPKD